MNVTTTSVTLPATSVSTPSKLTYTVWLYLGEYVVAQIGMSFAVCAYLYVLYYYTLKKHRTAVNISLTMTLFMVNQLIYAIAASIHFLYLILLWRLEEVIYDAFFLYWSGCFMQYTFIICIGSHIALTIDRCLLIRMNLRYTLINQKHFAIVTQILSYAISLGMYCAVNLKSMPLKAETSCRISACVHTTVIILGIPSSIAYPCMRIFYSAINIIVGVALVMQISHYNNSGVQQNGYVVKKNKITNKLVIRGVALDIVLDFLIYALPLLTVLLTGWSVAPYIGPYTHISNAIQVFLSAINYYTIFKQADEQVKKTALVQLASSKV